MPDAWNFLQVRLGPSTRIPYLSVDLCGGEAARVKVYLALGSSDCSPGQALRWLQALSAREPGAPSRRTLTCHAFRSGGVAPTFTLHVPVRCHVRDDREALTRARALCRGEGAACIERVISALADRPLESARGMLTYLSLSTGAAGTRMTAYLAPQLYRLDSPEPPKVARIADTWSA